MCIDSYAGDPKASCEMKIDLAFVGGTNWLCTRLNMHT